MAVATRTRQQILAADDGLCAFHFDSGERCENPVWDETYGLVVAQIAHICSGKEDGPRHDPSMDASRVDSKENLLLLCGSHHPVVDEMEGLTAFLLIFLGNGRR